MTQIDELVEGLAAELCDDKAARVLAGQTSAPAYFDSAPHVQEYWQVIAKTALESLAKRERELVEGLRPFSLALGRIPETETALWPDSETIEFSGADEHITWGDLRRARSLISDGETADERVG